MKKGKREGETKKKKKIIERPNHNKNRSGKGKKFSTPVNVGNKKMNKSAGKEKQGKGIGGKKVGGGKREKLDMQS